MAAPVGVAHLTGTAISHPSVFEILSHEGFATALKPAVAHIVKVLAERDPTGKFGAVYQYFDELYLGFDAVVQWHYILTRGATLSEAFYGMERKVTTTADKHLTRIRFSYLVSVLVPYVSDKLAKLYKQATEENSNSVEGQIAQRNLNSCLDSRVLNKQLIYKLAFFYPYVIGILKAINLLYLLSYTFGRSQHHNLTFKLLKMTLCYTSEERLKYLECKNAELLTPSQWKNFKNVPKLMMRSLGESVLWAVEIGTFIIQFLDWWYHDEKRARIAVSSQTIPPAPHTLGPQKLQSFVTLLPTDMNKCPLCRDGFRNPTAISVSGIVYCYGCIFAYLKQDQRCPLTKLPCNNNHLIRVYR